MKTLNILFSCIVLAIMASCSNQHIEMNTVVNADGTCVRELTFIADSASLVNPEATDCTFILGEEVFGNDDWQKTWSVKGETLAHQYPMTVEQYDSLKKELANQGFDNRVKDTVRIHAVRKFKSVDEMASTLPIFLKNSKERLMPEIKLEKKYRWFYTDYIYTESYPSLAPEFDIPLSDFMDEQSMTCWLLGDPTFVMGLNGSEQKQYLDKMETSFYLFVRANMYHDITKIIAVHYDLLTDAPLTKEDFQERTKEAPAYHENEERGIFDIDFKYLDQCLGTDYYANIPAEHPELDNLWEDRYSHYYNISIFDVDYRLTIPGSIVNTNDCGNCWFADGVFHSRITGLRLLTPDSYTITAKSSDKNNWMLLLTLLLILTSIGLCIVAARRSKA